MREKEEGEGRGEESEEPRGLEGRKGGRGRESDCACECLSAKESYICVT